MILQGVLSKSEDGAAPSAMSNIFVRWVCTCDEGDAVPQLRSRYTNDIHALARTRHSPYRCKSCFCPGHCVTDLSSSSTSAGTHARHVSTTCAAAVSLERKSAFARQHGEDMHAVQFLCTGMRLGVHMQCVLPADNGGVFVMAQKRGPAR